MVARTGDGIPDQLSLRNSSADNALYIYTLYTDEDTILPKSVFGPAKSFPNFWSLIVSLSGGSKKSVGLSDLSLPAGNESMASCEYHEEHAIQGQRLDTHKDPGALE